MSGQSTQRKSTMRVSNIIHSRQLYYVYLFVYALCIIFLLYHHEPWGEELNGWRIAKNYDIIEIFKLMSREGHFMLWFMLSYPFAHLGFPPITMGLISCGLLLFAGYILLFKSKFPLIVRLILLFSYPFIYCFPVIIRCYALVPPILFLLAWVYPQRHEKGLIYGILLGLMANIHLYMEGFYMTMLFIYIYESIEMRKRIHFYNKNSVIGILLAVLGGIIALSQIIGVLFQESSRAIIGSNALSNVYIFSMFMESYFNLPTRAVFIYFAIYLALFSCVFYVLYKIFHYEWKYYIILFVPILYQILFARYVFALNFQRVYLPFLILIFVFWIQKSKSKYASILLSFLAFSISVQGSKLIKYDLKADFGIEYKVNCFLSEVKPKNLYVIHDALLAIDSFNEDIPYFKIDNFENIDMSRLPDEFSILMYFWSVKPNQDEKIQKIIKLGYKLDNVIIESNHVNDAVNYSYHYYHFKKND